MPASPEAEGPWLWDPGWHLPGQFLTLVPSAVVSDPFPHPTPPPPAQITSKILAHSRLCSLGFPIGVRALMSQQKTCQARDESESGGGMNMAILVDLTSSYVFSRTV